jgi:hypothetical protein
MPPEYHGEMREASDFGLLGAAFERTAGGGYTRWKSCILSWLTVTPVSVI